MQTKDIATIALAAMAFAFSIASFILTFRQRALEGRQNTRKALTDAIAELTKVNLAWNQLDLDHPNSMESTIVSFRRNYNSQRRYLANHGEFLESQIPELSTDIDCIALASAFDASADYAKAQKFFEKAVKKSPNNVLRMWNLRGLARFWFNQGNAARGRKTYEESLQLEVPDTDSVRNGIADTYLLWATLEEEHGFAEEGQRVRTLGQNAANRIGNRTMRENMLRQLTSKKPDLEKVG